MVLQVPSTQLPALSGFPRLLVWISPHSRSLPLTFRRSQRHIFLNYFPMIFLANRLLWQDHRLFSFLSLEAQLQNMSPLHS